MTYGTPPRGFGPVRRGDPPSLLHQGNFFHFEIKKTDAEKLETKKSGNQFLPVQQRLSFYELPVLRSAKSLKPATPASFAKTIMGGNVVFFINMP